jgi:Arc/MetJ-type ribon-helix-helix transcriptional regulator
MYGCLCTDGVGTLNVRLSEEDARVVQELKRHGISVSDVVRNALRARAAEALVPEDTDAVLEEMFRRFPIAAPRLRIDVSDRRAVRRVVRRKLLKKRP